VIAAEVAGDPETYSEAILGRPNADYCRWILGSDHWGGAIELSILSRCGRRGGRHELEADAGQFTRMR
jgi:ubiquitin thioesterase OTU1